MAVTGDPHAFSKQVTGKVSKAVQIGTAYKKQVLPLLLTEEKAGGGKNAREKLAWGLLYPVLTHSHGHACLGASCLMADIWKHFRKWANQLVSISQNIAH